MHSFIFRAYGKNFFTNHQDLLSFVFNQNMTLLLVNFHPPIENKLTSQVNSAMSALMPLFPFMLDSIQHQLLRIGHCQAETFLICSSQYLTIPYYV